MNKQESDILNVILQYHCRNQRALAERCGFSLGMVNRSVKALQGQGFLTESSKSPASIAKSNKQWVGTCLYQEECKLLLISCGAAIRL